MKAQNEKESELRYDDQQSAKAEAAFAIADEAVGGEKNDTTLLRTRSNAPLRDHGS